MGKVNNISKNSDEQTVERELKKLIHEMIDDISNKRILIKAYTFIKYLN